MSELLLRRRALMMASRREEADFTTFSFLTNISTSTEIPSQIAALGLETANTILLLKSADSYPNNLLMATCFRTFLLRIRSGAANRNGYNQATVDAVARTTFRYMLVPLDEDAATKGLNFITTPSAINNPISLNSFIRSNVTVDRPTVAFVPKPFSSVQNYGFLYGLLLSGSQSLIRRNGSIEQEPNYAYNYSCDVPAGGKICIYQPEIAGL